MSDDTITLTTTARSSMTVAASPATSTVAAACIAAAVAMNPAAASEPPPSNPSSTPRPPGVRFTIGGVTGAFLSAFASVGRTTTRNASSALADRIFERVVSNTLKKIDHVDSAKMGGEVDDELTIFVLAKEHGLVDRDALLAVEEQLSQLRGRPVRLAVRAHQGRELTKVVGEPLLFVRG